jgi:hypothetical protein
MQGGPWQADSSCAMKEPLLPQGDRGHRLLLEHCAALTDDVRPAAFQRLEQTLGGELARLLVGALARRRGERTATLLV